MTLGRLASHVAELPARCATIITTETYVRQPGTPPYLAASSAELLEKFSATSAEARAALLTLSDDQLSVIWTIKMGDRSIASLPRAMAVRRIFMDHHIHHRAQLGVYLRLLNIPIPGMYGPSADDQSRT
jgi:uncharacterized damage-inducible protein DinB